MGFAVAHASRFKVDSTDSSLVVLLLVLLLVLVALNGWTVATAGCATSIMMMHLKTRNGA